MNLSEAQSAVIDRGFDYATPGQLTLWLNTGKDRFEDMWEWPWLWTPFNAVTPLVLPSLKLILTVASGGRELLGLDMRQVAQDGADLTQKGVPEYWWLEAEDTLHAWPGDGATVTGVMVADTPPLVAPTDTPLIPARYHSLWIDLAVCEGYVDSDNFGAAQALRGDVNLRMQDVITRYETRNRQHSPFITVRGPYSEDE